MALVNWMYQTSLAQFLKWFDYALLNSTQHNLVTQRVNNIIDFMTYYIYDNVNRGLFGDDKLTFKIMCSLRICLTDGKLDNDLIQTFLKAGSTLGTDKLPKKSFDWLQINAWANIIALSNSIDFLEIYQQVYQIMKNNGVYGMKMKHQNNLKFQVVLLIDFHKSKEQSAFYENDISTCIKR